MSSCRIISRCMLEAGTVSYRSPWSRDWLTISANRVVRILNEGRNDLRHVEIPLMRLDEAFVESMAFCAQSSVAFFRTHDASMNVIQVVLQGEKAHLSWVDERFRRCTRLRNTGLVRHRGRIRVSMDQGMPRSSPLDLAQAGEVASSEIAVPVLELPQRGIW